MTSRGIRLESAADIPPRVRSTFEDRFLSYLGCICDPMIQLELEFANQLDADRLSRAFDLVLDAEPVLGCRFAHKCRRPYWERLGKDERERIDLLLTEDGGVYEAFKKRSIDTHTGPQVEGCLWRSSAGDRLLVKVAHVAADVGGIKEIAAAVSSIYSRLADEPAYRPRPNSNGSRGLWQVMQQVPWHAYPRIYLSSLHGIVSRMVRRRAPRLPLDDGPRTSLAFPQRLLPADRAARLTAYARRRGATLNDVFLAAFFRALVSEGEWNGRSRLSVATTVDLRQWYLPNGKGAAVANLSAFEYPSLGTGLGDDFESTLGAVSSITRRRKADWIGLRDWVVLLPLSILHHAWGSRILGNVLQHVVKKRASPLACLTNMGPIDPGSVTFDAPPRSAWLLPPPGYPPHFVAGLSGYAGTLSVSAGAYRAGKEVVERFLDQLLSELPP